MTDFLIKTSVFFDPGIEPFKYSKLFSLSAFITSLIGVWHSGVELEFFYLPEGCSSSGIGSINTVQDLINKPMINCNVIAWSFLGLSMTNWNTILSLVETSIFLYLAYLIKDLHHEKIKHS